MPLRTADKGNKMRNVYDWIVFMSASLLFLLTFPLDIFFFFFFATVDKNPDEHPSIVFRCKSSNIVRGYS